MKTYYMKSYLGMSNQVNFLFKKQLVGYCVNMQKQIQKVYFHLLKQQS